MENYFIDKICKEFSFSRITASILIERGFSSIVDIKSFLYPSEKDLANPYDLKGMNDAVSLIREHFSKKSKIVIYGDYDCDGVGAASILYLAFQKNGIISEVFLPNREEDGYGLKLDSIDKMLLTYKPDLLITVDCGIQSVEEVEYLQQLGIEVIVTDHHEPGASLPKCICINPKIQTEYDELSGAGVAFMLISAVFGKKEALEYVDICAISTVTDLVPLVKSNRIIVSLGLNKINSDKSNLGLKCLIDFIMRKEDKNVIIKSSDIAYKIGPRLNASGRISSAFKSFKLLISKDITEINQIINDLEIENKYRQDLCIDTIESVKNMLLEYDLSTHRVILLYNEKWEAGVIGIAASKIAEEFNKPTILLTKNNNCAKGSCRSIKGINIYDVLKSNSQFLNNYGGHEMAAGLSLDYRNINPFLESCDTYIYSNYPPELFKTISDNAFNLDDISDVNIQLTKELSLFEPFGMNNRKPIFSVCVGSLNFSPINSYPHIKYELTKNIRFIGFNKIDYLEILQADVMKRIRFSLNFENFRKREYATCFVLDISLKSFDIDNHFLAYNDLSRYILTNNPETMFKNPYKPNDYFGRIVLVWNYNNFLLAMENYPNYILKFMKLDSFNTFNTILFSPNKDETFEYFSEIILFDIPPKNYIDHMLKKYSNITLVSRTDIFPNNYLININQNHLNTTYSFLRKYLPEIINSQDPKIIFSFLVSKGFTITIHMFKLCCIILLELGYLKIDTNTQVWSIAISSRSLDESIIYNRLKN